MNSLSSSANSHLSAYYLLVQKALRSLPELQIIKLLVHDTHFITFIKHCTFPSLRHFESYLKLSNSLIKFLNRHPNITYLQVSPYEDTSVLSDDIFQTLSLPKLQYFAGNGQSVPAIGDASILRAAIVSWDAVDTAPDVAIKALERSSFDTLTLLSCTRRGWNLDLIQIISNHLPDILSLHISNVLLVDTDPSEVSRGFFGGEISRTHSSIFVSISLTSKRYGLSFVILPGFAYSGSIALITGKWVT